MWIFDNLTLSNINIDLGEDTVLVLKGDTSISSDRQVNSKPVKITGPGMIVQYKGSFYGEGLSFEGQKSVGIRGVSWSGGVNFIEANVALKSCAVSDNHSEDAINFVHSSTDIDTLTVGNSPSDAIDVDFGEIRFDEILCENIGNDCLDTSGAEVDGVSLEGVSVGDKLFSAGEDTSARISTLKGDSIGIGVVSKDASNVEINNLELTNTSLFAAAFNKKEFFGVASLTIDNTGQKFSEKMKDDRFLVARNNYLSVDGGILLGAKKSSAIEALMYGAVYGKATNRAR
ncbi:MAG: hypothetical protein OET90_09245, partial [Desulfuromonadales bacterium]|nr:hypothetical protein [Desulfuromonadales bacterium]